MGPRPLWQNGQRRVNVERTGTKPVPPTLSLCSGLPTACPTSTLPSARAMLLKADQIVASPLQPHSARGPGSLSRSRLPSRFLLLPRCSSCGTVFPPHPTRLVMVNVCVHVTATDTQIAGLTVDWLCL